MPGRMNISTYPLSDFLVYLTYIMIFSYFLYFSQINDKLKLWGLGKTN